MHDVISMVISPYLRGERSPKSVKIVNSVKFSTDKQRRHSHDITRQPAKSEHRSFSVGRRQSVYRRLVMEATAAAAAA